MSSVKMYTTAVCPYCIRAKQILKARGVEQIEEIRIDVDPTARAHMMEVTGRRTVPQIFIGDTMWVAATIWWRSTAGAACCRCCRRLDATVAYPSCRPEIIPVSAGHREPALGRPALF